VCKSNAKSKRSNVGVIDPVIMWNIFASWNEFIFEELQSIRHSIISATIEWSHSPICEDRWQKGDQDTLELNVDGIAMTNPERATLKDLCRIMIEHPIWIR
jgi:hypothetical protein